MNEETPRMQPDPEVEIQYPTEGFASVAHKINQQLYEIDTCISRYAQNPSEKNEDMLESMRDIHLVSMVAALKVYRGEFDSDEAALKGMMLYVCGIEQRRINHLNGLHLSSEEEFAPEYSGTLNELYEEMLVTLKESEDTAIGIVGDHYASGLTSHAQKLTFDAVSAYENSPRATRKRAFRRLGGHALDVAKIAAGAVIGVGIAQHTLRRRP